MGERRQAGQTAAQTARAVKPPVAVAGGRNRVPRRNRLPRRSTPRRRGSLRRPKPEPPPLAPIGRRERSQLSRGRKEIDARLDLHGMTQTRAHRALFGFLQRAHHDGLTFVLVITGKGKIGARVRARRAAPSGAAMAEPAGIPLAGGRLRGSPYRPWRRGRAVCPGAAGGVTSKTAARSRRAGSASRSSRRLSSSDHPPISAVRLCEAGSVFTACRIRNRHTAQFEIHRE